MLARRQISPSDVVKFGSKFKLNFGEESACLRQINSFYADKFDHGRCPAVLQI